MSETDIRSQLRTWIINRAKTKPTALADNVPVLEQGILTSLDIVELVLYIERLRGGREVEVDALDPAAFRDINSMYATFFAAA
jgi:acyl carrier protein